MNKLISTEIAAARARIEGAERALGAAIATAEGGRRADKVTVNAAVGEALKQLRDAKSALDSLESAVLTEER